VKIDVFFTPGELRTSLKGRVAAVIDVLRATSTIVEAIANGARSIYPAATVDDAVRLAQSLGRKEVLLTGERESKKIEGFDLGNSPREFTREAVEDKVVVMSTTNGTPALVAGATADKCLVASFLNLDAVATQLASTDAPVTLICSGREGCFSLDDALCAGVLLSAIRSKRKRRLILNDAALAASALERRYHNNLPSVISQTAAARQIVDAGLADDIAYCMMHNRHSVVPVMSDRQVTLDAS
jgi:2-phosphosulfolactate phosphatase